MQLIKQSFLFFSLLACSHLLQAQAVAAYYNYEGLENIKVDVPKNSSSISFSQSMSFEEYFQGDSLTSINQNSAAGIVTNFSLDTLCEVLLISIADPSTTPLPAFNAYQVNATDENGEPIKNIEGVVNTSFRVTSPEEVTLDILFRSGEGTTNERSERKSFTVPAGLGQWTEFTLSWSDAELDGFDPTDMRDMWFYLDRGEENFAGNKLYIDHITIGTAPDAAQNSACIFVSVPQDWTENWDANSSTEFGGSDIDRLEIAIDETCEEVKIEVIAPIENPFQAFRPISLDPLDDNELDIGLISDNPFLSIRARSAEDVQLGVLLRSKDGTSDFRTELLTQTIIGDLTAYSNLIFEFDATSIGGFDREDFLDIWIYLDREVDNFAGNEVYFDFVSLGVIPDTSNYSPCGLPDLIINGTENLFGDEIKVYPNPVSNILSVEIPQSNNLDDIVFEVTNMLGQKVISQQMSGQKTAEINLLNIEHGLYYLNILTNNRVHKTIKFIKL